MQQETDSTQPQVQMDDSLQAPKPPDTVFVEMPGKDVPENHQPAAVANAGNTAPGNKVAGEQAGNIPEREEKPTPREPKAQDFDWQNGKPAVTPEEVETLPAHKTPETELAASLRENKGEKPGTDAFEASEEVNTGQNGG